MLKEIISLLPENSLIKIYKNGNPISRNSKIGDIMEFANLFADIKVKKISAIHLDDCGIVYLIEII